MLPLSAPPGAAGRGPQSIVFGAQFAPLTRRLPGLAEPDFWSRYVRRAVAFSSWDLEYVFYQLINACRSPEKLYKLTQHRKQTKNQWARDDPAFAMILCALLAVTAVAYGVAYGYRSPLAYAWLIAQSLLNFALFGAVTAGSCWAIASRHMRSAVPLPHSVEQDVELLYAWDVHCNAYVAVFLGPHVGQLLLLPLIARDGFLGVLLGDSIYAAALAYYCYVTFEGYLGAHGKWAGWGLPCRWLVLAMYESGDVSSDSSPSLAPDAVLPFLHRQTLFLAPIGVLGVAYVLALALQVRLLALQRRIVD